MIMNEKYIRKLIKIVEDSKIEALEVSSWGRKVKITQKLTAGSNGQSTEPMIFQPAPVPVQTALASAPQTSAASAPEPVIDTGNLVEIKSPMVGTFYAAPSPDADPYVSLNEKISAGQVVCIVEAMKLMNEIEAEQSGRVVKILVENAQPVEFGQTIFLIDPKG